MNILIELKNLLIDQREFFKTAPKGLKIPFLITLIYALISSIASIPPLMTVADSLKGNMGTAVIIISVLSVIISAFIVWIFVSLMFFISLRLFGKINCKFEDVMGVVSYGAVPLSIEVIITSLISLIGTPDPLAALLLSGAILFWTVPIWVFGFQSITDEPENKIMKCVIAVVIVMAAATLISFGMSMSAAQTAGYDLDYSSFSGI